MAYDVLVGAMGFSQSMKDATVRGEPTVKEMIGDMKMTPHRGSDAPITEDANTGHVRIMGFAAGDGTNLVLNENKRAAKATMAKFKSRRDENMSRNLGGLSGRSRGRGGRSVDARRKWERLAMNALDSVLRNPRSIATRRALLASWRESGDPRAELLELQLRRHDGLGMKSRKTVPAKIRELISDHGREWAGRIAESVNSFEFELGLVAQVDIDAPAFVEHGDDLVTLAPLLHLLVGPPIDMEKFCAVPALRQISTLIFEGGEWFGDREAEVFASSPNVRGIRVATLSGGRITDVGLRALAASPNLPDLVYLELTGNPCTDRAHRGVRATEINGNYYLLGKAAGPYLEKARDAAAVSYDVMNLSEWPPSWTDVAWSE